MNIEKKILEIYDEINKSKKSLSRLNEAALISPVDSPSVNSGFGPRWGKTHNGVDLAANAAEVKAPADGVVDIAAIKNDDCGGTITINHAGGFKTGFCHLQKINVSSGQSVKQGDVIGISGGGANDIGHGRSDGRHLHFTLRKDGQLVNPMDYIDKDSIVMKGSDPLSVSPSSSFTSDEVEKAYKDATGSQTKTPLKTSYGQILQNVKSAGGLSEMIETKKEFKKFLMSEASTASNELFGGNPMNIPADGGHGNQRGWYNQNAWDIKAAIGTPVYAVIGGTVKTFNDYGPTPIHKDGKTLFGIGFTIDSDNNLPDVYYTHLKDTTVKIGDKVQCGQLLGYVMDFPNNDYDHLHIAVESGHVRQYLNDDGTLKCAKGQSISGTTASGSTSTSGAGSTAAAATAGGTSSYALTGGPKRDEFVYDMAKKIGDTFLPKESIEEQKKFGAGVQNRYGRVIIPGDSNPKIKSPISGVVYNKKFFGSCKNQITIKNEDNGKVYLQFCGIDTPQVKDGMSVSEGQIIGKTNSDVEVTLYDSSWNRIHIGDKFEIKKKEKEQDKEKGKKKSEKERYYTDPAVALMASLPAMAFEKIFGDRYDKGTGELKQKRWGGVADKRQVDPWVIDYLKKPFGKKVNEDIERIKKLLK
jgi:murein DD-endopeptidase MepM/ murein hydrolase activator NlpD